jgi:hypothetical protein
MKVIEDRISITGAILKVKASSFFNHIEVYKEQQELM